MKDMNVDQKLCDIENRMKEKIDNEFKEINEKVEYKLSSNNKVVILVISLMMSFLGVIIWLITDINSMKSNYMTKVEVTYKITLPMKLLMAKIDKVSAKTDNDQDAYKKAAVEEQRIMNDIISGSYKPEPTRGGIEHK